jgi:hypothetical protein
LTAFKAAPIMKTLVLATKGTSGAEVKCPRGRRPAWFGASCIQDMERPAEKRVLVVNSQHICQQILRSSKNVQ